MYVPANFREDRPEVLHAVMRDNPFALMVTSGAEGLSATHLPFEFDPEAGPHGTLRGHVARANPHWRALAEGTQALVVFQGPHSYITPSWYATKAETGRVVPTWNYVAVHATGKVSSFNDPERLRPLLDTLTRSHESAFAMPWQVSDAPEDFIATMLKGIVGLEVAIERLEGKCKASQNRPAADRQGVVDGLRQRPGGDAAAMADLVAATLES